MNKIAIMMRIKLDGEALNNEGSIGNVMMPRQIELSDGTVRNAISGEMLKHFHTRNLRLLADENELCIGCKDFSPMKNADVPKNPELSNTGDRVKQCIVDDIEGFLNLDKKPNEKRTSCVKFSMAIATEENDYQLILHNRVDNTERIAKEKKKSKNAESESETSEVQPTQMIFYRPVRCGEYAITIEVELDRIGFDDEKLNYILSEEEAMIRKQKCIKALINMFIDMEGAMCSTRLPHLRNIEGIINIKNDKNDVLIKYFALNNDYKQVNKNIATNCVEFSNVEEFIAKMDNLLK